jgi:hypothetical protein
MRHSDSRRLIDRGRKAGLHTGELYAALAARPPATVDSQDGQADGNGFVSGHGHDGRLVYRPVGGNPPG